jgi:2-oxoisovalerate dehydrogenase E2 component (dihydrolipoyl transacylase)
MALREFALPDLGEGLTEGEILQWLVSEGDVITLNQPIVEVETAKAAVEVPSPFAGTVTQLCHPAGSTVDVGSVIIRVEDGIAAPERAERAVVAPEADLVPAPKREAVLVGYGVKQGAAVRRARVNPANPAVAAVPVPAAGAVAPARPLAKPPVRKLARDLGVDLAELTPSAADGVITRADVQAASVAMPSAPAPRSSARAERQERRVPIQGVRKLVARAMVASAFTAPHVTLFMTVDVTQTMELVTRMRRLPELAEVKVTPLLLVAKALLAACQRYPEFNARWDEEAQEILVYAGVNLGIAAATPRGLIVPNIKDADLLSLVELARALQTLTETARSGRTTAADMTGGTLTITNVGVFGMDSGTPILNPGESGILCFGAVRAQPWVHEGQIAVRQVTQLSMSFDHRLVDGQLGAEVLGDIGRALEDPMRLLAWR